MTWPGPLDWRSSALTITPTRLSLPGSWKTQVIFLNLSEFSKQNVSSSAQAGLNEVLYNEKFPSLYLDDVTRMSVEKIEKHIGC